jgi:hypothetical protein
LSQQQRPDERQVLARRRTKRRFSADTDDPQRTDEHQRSARNEPPDRAVNAGKSRPGRAHRQVRTGDQP